MSGFIRSLFHSFGYVPQHDSARDSARDSTRDSTHDPSPARSASVTSISSAMASLEVNGGGSAASAASAASAVSALCPPPTQSTRAVLYARVSTTDQSMAAQLHCLAAFAAARGFTVTLTIQESGSAWKAPEQLQLRPLLESQQDTNLIIFDESRFSRNTAFVAELIRICKRNRISVYVAGVAEPYVCAGADVGWGRLWGGVSGAEQESDIRSARSAASQRARAAMRPARARRDASDGAPRAPRRAPAPFGARYVAAAVAGSRARTFILERFVDARGEAIIELVRQLFCGTAEMEPLYALFNQLAPAPDDPMELMGTEIQFLADDYGYQIEKVERGQFSFTYVYTLLNAWQIYARPIVEGGRPKRWTKKSMQALVQFHLGDDAVALATQAEYAYSVDEMEENDEETSEDSPSSAAGPADVMDD